MANRNGAAEVVIEVGADARTAAERLARALEQSEYARPASPRLDGEISFPQVTIWRSRGPGIKSPYAQFEGSICDVGGATAIVGRVKVPALDLLTDRREGC